MTFVRLCFFQGAKALRGHEHVGALKPQEKPHHETTRTEAKSIMGLTTIYSLQYVEAKMTKNKNSNEQRKPLLILVGLAYHNPQKIPSRVTDYEIDEKEYLAT